MITKRIKLSLMLALACLTLLSFTACAGQKDEIQRELVEVTRGDIAFSVTGDGNLSLPRHRKLTFDTSGEITEVNVDEGDRVTTGQVLAGLDTTSLKRGIRTAELAVTSKELAITKNELAVTTAEIELDLTEDAIATAEIDLEQAKDNLRKITYPYTYSTFFFDVPDALVAIRDAEREVKEAQESLEVGLSSEQFWEVWHQLRKAKDNLVDARERLSRGTGQDVFEEQLLAVKDFWTLRAAELAVEKAESALTQAKNKRVKANLALAKAKNDLDSAKNDLDSAHNDLDKARDELEKAVIVAPFDGLIAKADARPGDSLSAMDYATETIVEIIDPSRMELTAEVDEIDIPQAKPGQRAIITLDALPDVQLEGKVTFISPLSREEAGVILYEVEVGFNVPQGLALKAGMSATVDIVIDQRSNILLVPSRAITQDGSGNTVVRVMVDEEVEERAVVTGISDAYQTEIVSGLLKEGELVVVERKVKPESAGGLFGG